MIKLRKKVRRRVWPNVQRSLMILLCLASKVFWVHFANDRR
ncbi:CRM-domain containing factor CFM3, chloroplastic/mitochondrial [Iris pallida]|uniref:CRM-domain containing factor CFM3, chloroplastic/mitochondrial n=1 Tax=Iris pallida TaxID=29817 RepID=A0AAX6GIG7_IRIPA|nr:CRM-domain containing factor CFM3, chloroplastic/mitochondrial [Iris pallida]